MKKAIVIIMMFSFKTVVACDICGCGVGNNYIGILPEFQKHIFGFRYRYNSIFSHVGIGGSTTYLTTKEKYNIVESWAGWNINKKFRIMASIPLNFNEKQNQSTTQNKNGIGDITLLGYYELINKRKIIRTKKLLVQSLWIGGGVKLATGKYNSKDKNSGSNNSNLFQLGTGSYDFNINAMYDVRLQDIGINISTNYKINTANKYLYAYGNKFNINTQFYYKYRIKNKILLAPNAGLQFESSKVDNDNGFKVFASGGKILNTTFGVEAVFKKIATGLNFQAPIAQNLANGIVHANNRFMMHVAYAL